MGIDNDKINKRIAEMKYDTYPIDRMLPLATVYKLFSEEYNKSVDKSIFFKKRKYQRLREGYFSLFVAVLLSKISGCNYFIHFPEEAGNDVNILSVKDEGGTKPVFWKLVCDVKEFTHYSSSFDEFVQRTIVPKIRAKSYHLIIGNHQGIEGSDLESLVKLSSKEMTIWVVSAYSPKGDDCNSGVVTVLQGRDMVSQYKIDLSKNIVINGDPMIIYQDVLRDKMC